LYVFSLVRREKKRFFSLLQGENTDVLHFPLCYLTALIVFSLGVFGCAGIHGDWGRKGSKRVRSRSESSPFWVKKCIISFIVSIYPEKIFIIKYAFQRIVMVFSKLFLQSRKKILFKLLE